MATDVEDIAACVFRLRGALTPLVGNALDAWSVLADLKDCSGIHYDSMTVLEWVVLVEQEFGIQIDLVEDDLAHSFRSLTTIAQLVARKRADQHALGGQAHSDET